MALLFPKFEPLTGEDRVSFKRPGAARRELGTVIAPPGAPETAEGAGSQTGDLQDEELVHIQPDRGGPPIELPRAGLRKVLPGDPPELPQGELPRGPVALRPAVPHRVLRAAPRAELHPVPKPRTPGRTPAFLALVRSLPCAGCGLPAPSEAHHTGRRGVGQKADDLSCVPLCRGCHGEITDRYTLPGLDRDQAALRILRASQEILIGWVRAVQEPVAERGHVLDASHTHGDLYGGEIRRHTDPLDDESGHGHA